MFNRILLFLSMFLFVSPLYASEGKLNIVATTAYNADLVKKIGGGRVNVDFVASPKFNVHFIQPKPSDVRKLAKADLYVNGGLDLEAWSDPLAEAAGKPEFFRGGERSVDLSNGIRLLGIPQGALSRSGGDMHLFGNPHYVMGPENALVMAATLAQKLKELDGAHATFYDANLSQFQSEMKKKIGEWKALCSHCAGKEVYSYHEDIEYLAEFLGLKATQFIETKPGIPPSPRHLQELEDYARANHVQLILQPTYFDKSASDALAEKIAGKVILIAQNVGEIPGAEDIFSFYDYNVKQIAEALK